MTKKMLKKKFLIEQGKQEERERIIGIIKNMPEDNCGWITNMDNNCDKIDRHILINIIKEEAGK